MQRLMQRRYRLKTLLQSLHHPRTCKIDIGNEIVQLPYKVPFRLPSYSLESSVNQVDMEKLAYGFSVFGWVTPLPRSSGISISVTTRYSRGFLPVIFCRTFGGSVYVDRNGKGMALPRIIWRVARIHAIEVCKFLSRLEFKSRKREVLEIGAAWPSGRNESRKAVSSIKEIRKNIRDNFFKNAKVETWSDFAELFDGRGQISVSQRKKMRIAVCHRSYRVLKSICAFLEIEDVALANPLTRICRKKSNSYWFCVKQLHIGIILSKLMDHGLVFQRSRAEAALRLLDGKEEWHVSLSRLPDATNLMKYRRASLEECQVRELLLYLSTQIERQMCSLPLQRDERKEMLRGLKKYQERMKMVKVMKDMRKDVRSLLQELKRK